MNEAISPPRRFGVYLQNRSLFRWEADVVARLEQEGLQAVSFGADPGSSSNGSFTRALMRLAGFGPQLRRLFEPVTTCANQGKAAGSPAPGGGETLSFILFFGSGAIPDWLAAHAQHGVWSFDRSDRSLGGLPFIDDLCRSNLTVTFALRCFQAGGSGARLLWGGQFRAARRRADEVCGEILGQAARWPTLAARSLALNGAPPKAMIQPSGEDRVPIRPELTALRLLARWPWNVVDRWITNYLTLESWKVGLFAMDVRDLVDGAPIGDVAWLKPLEPGSYYADPFILSTHPQIELLVEDYQFGEPARISLLRLGADHTRPEIVNAAVCLDTGHHMSYPYLFTDGGRLYCLPECHESNRCTLYSWTSAGPKPERDVVLGARVVDGSIMFDGARYWLFCGLEDDADQVNLHLFYADRLDGGWQPHRLNPVKTDVASSRSAGQLFAKEGHLYRPAQDCSSTYGSALVINRLDILTPTEFRETTVRVIRPEAMCRSCRGVHTLSFADGLVAIDAKLEYVGWVPFVFRLRRLLRGLLAKWPPLAKGVGRPEAQAIKVASDEANIARPSVGSPV